MVKLSVFFLALLLSWSVSAQELNIPQWFINDINENIGVWTADNSEFKSGEEPFDFYEIEWTWGIGKTSIVGKMYGITKGEKSENFWEFRQYWDGETQKAIVVQYGNSGVVGFGHISLQSRGYLELVQTFSLTNGTTWKEKHISKSENGKLTTQTFEFKNNKWQKRRFYEWFKQ